MDCKRNGCPDCGGKHSRILCFKTHGRKTTAASVLAGARPLSPTEQWCEEQYKETHRRDENGRYVVTLLIDPASGNLGDSKQIALRRFYMLESRLSKEPETREKYVKFMREYESLGHMIRADRIDLSGRHYFVPHFCIQLKNKGVEKFRVVFDGSCATTNGRSLNDILQAGPKLQEDLIYIIFRFRMFKIAVTADIKKMYRQVKVSPEQWNYQCVLWREAPNMPLLMYWLVVLTYGLKSSDFNAIKTLIQCANDNGQQFPIALLAILLNFFKDDFLGGADSEEKARQLKAEVEIVLEKGGFEMAKWASNSTTVLQNEMDSRTEHELTEDETSVLGLVWTPKTDDFRFKVRLAKVTGKLTKRMVTSQSARIFGACCYKRKKIHTAPLENGVRMGRGGARRH